MLLRNVFASSVALASICAGAPVSSYPVAITARSGCSASRRLAAAEQIPYAYNLVAFGASAAAFAKVPFASNCTTFINADGLPAIQVAVDGATTYDFAVESRQAFSDVTGKYTDFPGNLTTVIATNVTLGLLHTIPVPVTFFANVYLVFTSDSCEIYKVQAFANVPSQILGYLVESPNLGYL